LTGKKYQTDTSADSAPVETPNDIAKQIADLLNNPNVPTRLTDAIQEGLTDVYNNADHQAAINDEWKTPEYIERLLSLASK
jgi:nitrate reductase beta subunit